MNELALFAGAGGGLLGTRLLGWSPVCAVEINAYCREVILRRQEEGHLEPFPIWDDVRTFDGKPWCGRVDVVTGGFPCQPFSAAGKNEGEDDPRNMWPDTIRIIREVGPRFCLLENVPNLLAHEYYGTILGQISESGYCCRWDCIPASSVAANHERDRLWLALTSTPDPTGIRIINRKLRQSDIDGITARQWWEGKPPVRSLGDGVAYRVDRLRALGNGQVPAVVRAAWMLLSGETE